MSRIPIIWARRNRRKLDRTRFSRKEIPFSFPDRINWSTEHRFHQSRMWRFDYAHVGFKIAVEIEGGVWKGYGKHDDGDHKGGRHNTAQGFLGDMEKYNAAVDAGWHLFRFTPEQLDEGEASWFLTQFYRKINKAGGKGK